HQATQLLRSPRHAFGFQATKRAGCRRHRRYRPHGSCRRHQSSQEHHRHEASLMISQTNVLSYAGAGPTVWGLTPTQLHDRYWAARGIQVVRQGEPSEIVSDAELFLLTDPRTLTIFKLARVVETLSWIKPEI